MKIFYLIIIVTSSFGLCIAQSTSEKNEREIIILIQMFAESALKNNISTAEKIYAENLVLTSQSGKVYNKKDALLDLKNPFEKYQNEDFKFIHLNNKNIVVNYQNTRKRKNLDEAKYRVSTVWTKNKQGWQIVSLQSTKIATGM